MQLATKTLGMAVNPKPLEKASFLKDTLCLLKKVAITILRHIKTDLLQALNV